MTDCNTRVVVCDQRVLTVAVGMVISAVVLLLSKHFVYNIEYNPVVREVSLRKVDCVEDKISSESG